MSPAPKQAARAGARRPYPAADARYLRLALRLARRGLGRTSPNPAVGAVLVKGSRILGQGWHHAAGQPHAEIEALRDAQRRGFAVRGATLYVTLEPCCTHGRTPPCTQAIIKAGIKRVVAAATDPNPNHAGRGFRVLSRGGVQVEHGLLAKEAGRLNEAFNHWIVHRRPFVTVKAAMTLDGKIADADGRSQWITGEKARAYGQLMRRRADAILVGINTVLADDPALTIRPAAAARGRPALRRIILDSRAHTPLGAQVVADEFAASTIIVVGSRAPKNRVSRLAKHVQVWTAPELKGRVDLRWLLRRLGRENITSLLVEGGGEVNAAFLLGGFAHRIVFFYAPKILGGAASRKAVGGAGARNWSEILKLDEVEWRSLGADWMLTARVK